VECACSANDDWDNFDFRLEFPTRQGLEVGVDKRPQEQQEESVAREIASIFGAYAPQGRLQNAEESFP